MNNNCDEKYSELRAGLKEFMKNCDRAMSANEIKDIISKICPEIRNEIEKETAQEICDFIEENHTRDSYYDWWILWIQKHMSENGTGKDVPVHKGTPGHAYNMPYECAQEYISRRGLDAPINDGDVFVDERYLTQTIANVLRWADYNPVDYNPSPENLGFFRPSRDCPSAEIVRDTKMHSLDNIIKKVWRLGNEWKELTNGFSNTKYGTQLAYIKEHWNE